MHHTAPNHLADRFERFAVESAGQGAPFYSQLSRYVAADTGLLRIASHARREPIPNALFGAVHYLLLRNADHKLREYYPSLTNVPRNDARLGKTFSEFCMQYEDEITAVLSKRFVQTNETARCAILAPAFSLVHQKGNYKPLALVEIGASAGLNLLWDKYRVEYSDGSVHGNRDSAVLLKCEKRGIPFEVACLDLPTIRHRIGVDLNPLCVLDAEEQTWLRALVWPDQRQRALRLDAAIALAIDCGLPTLVSGDALVELPAILSTVPNGLTTCVYNSSALYQFAPEDRQKLARILSEASKECPLWHVSAESDEGLVLSSYGNGALMNENKLADFDAHGRWICWGD